MDAIVQVWWLAWAEFALTHGHRLLFTQWQNYPLGQNFGVNGSMLALGVVFMPITKLFGPLVTWSVLLRLGLAVSATSMCLVLRRWTRWWPAAFVGGLLYGFSAYTAWNRGQGGYLFLIFIPLPPLALLILDEILVRQRWRPRTAGVLLGVICAVQYFISSEILASTVVIGAIAVLVYVVACRRTFFRKWQYTVTSFVWSLATGAVLLIYPVWFTYAGPEHVEGAPLAPTQGAYLSGDLLSSVVPNGEWLGPGHQAIAAQSFANGAQLYLGVSFIIALVAFAILFRERKRILFAGAMAVISFILSLGTRLIVDGHITGIRLPFAVLSHVPVAQDFLPIRFSLYTNMFAAGLFALGLDELWTRLRRWGALRWSPGQTTVGRARDLRGRCRGSGHPAGPSPYSTDVGDARSAVLHV